MAKAEKNLEQLQPHLETGETVEAHVEGSYETKVMGTESVRKGILAATDRRMLFYAKKFTGYDLESFPYGNISSIEQGKNFMGGTLKFFASGNTASMKWIDVRKSNLGEFLTIVQRHVNTSRSPAGANNTPDSGVHVDIADQIRKLSDLKAEGILSEEEFLAKKTDLLKRL